MKILFPKQSSKHYIGSLNPLTIIKYEGGYYIVSAEKNTSDEIACINLHSGTLYHFSKHLAVEQISASLTIRGVIQNPERKEIQLTDGEADLIRAGKRLSVIKSIRERTWCSYSEAKRAFDAKCIELGV